jgi:pyruvate ferredoxin oxidoreductase alpha subunit
MSIRERLSGNEAAAIAMKQINPDVVAAFPITPSTEIPQYFSTFVSNGTVDTEFVAVESEHSAMSACIGAEAARSKSYDSYICKWTFINVGNDIYSFKYETSNSNVTCK